MVRLYQQDYCRLKSEINIIPLLDVLLVLLIIFIATVPVITQSIEIDLPNVTESQVIGNNSNFPVVIEVSLTGQYSMIIGKNHMHQLPLSQVITEVQNCLGLNPRTVFLVSGAKEAPYDEIIKVLNLLYNAGVKSVGLMTHQV